MAELKQCQFLDAYKTTKKCKIYKFRLIDMYEEFYEKSLLNDMIEAGVEME